MEALPILKTSSGVKAYDLTSGELTLPLSALGKITVPKLYGTSADLAAQENPPLEALVCVAPPIIAPPIRV